MWVRQEKNVGLGKAGKSLQRRERLNQNLNNDQGFMWVKCVCGQISGRDRSIGTFKKGFYEREHSVAVTPEHLRD